MVPRQPKLHGAGGHASRPRMTIKQRSLIAIGPEDWGQVEQTLATFIARWVRARSTENATTWSPAAAAAVLDAPPASAGGPIQIGVLEHGAHRKQR